MLQQGSSYVFKVLSGRHRETVTLAAGNQITREFQLALEAQQAMLSEAEQAGSPETTVPGRRGAWERGRGVAASVTEDSALASVA